MKKKWSQFIGLVILLAGAGGVYWLFRGTPATQEQAEAAPETVVPVQVGRIERKTLYGYVRTYGSVIPDPGTGGRDPAALVVTAPLEGRITDVNCQMGQVVQPGQVLFQLYDRAARLAVQEAEQSLVTAQKALERQQKLQTMQATSDKLYLEAQQQFNQANNHLMQMRAALERYQVTAPHAGTLQAVRVRVGQTVTLAQPLAELVDLHRLVVRAAVPSSEAGAIGPGQTVAVQAPGGTDANQPAIMGQVLYVDSQVDPNNGTVAVLTGLPQKCGLRNGQWVDLRITVTEHPNCLAVPIQSVVITPEGQTVVSVVQGQMAISTPVQLGLTEGTWVEIAGATLQPGTQVVTTGAYGLPDRTKIRIMEK